MESRGEVTQLLAAARAGDRDAMDRVFSILYADLREIASRQVSNHSSSHTLSTTALVHETYLKLVDRSRISPADRRHFLATAARAMRQLLVDYARGSRAQKRGGDAVRVSDTEACDLLDAAEIRIDERAGEILAVHEALARLDLLSARLGRVVELRFFGGLSIEETAELLGVSLRTVNRDWRTARAFLYSQLQGP